MQSSSKEDLTLAFSRQDYNMVFRFIRGCSILMILLVSGRLYTQNLVLNHSFETISACPFELGDPFGGR
jgi:hypothetical protein